MNNTFEKHSKRIPEFLDRIIKTNPDYIVPVEKKGCKLLRWLQLKKPISNIRYKQFFDNTSVNLKGLRIAIIDDASKYTSTLLRYRKYFESKGAIVDTYSFVGHIKIQNGERYKYDEKAIIFQYLEESAYQEYIIQQSQTLLKENISFDIDHIVFETKLSDSFDYDHFISKLWSLGEVEYTNDIYTPDYIENICLFNFSFPICLPRDICNISFSSLRKIRFSYNQNTNVIKIVPLVFPIWDISKDINSMLENLSFSVMFDGENISHEGQYMNLSYVCQMYLLNSFLKTTQECFDINSFSLMDYNIKAYVGDSHSAKIITSAIRFLKDSKSQVYCSKLNNKVFCSYSKAKLNSPRDLMYELREEYNKKLKQSPDAILNTHYYLSYDEIMARYIGNANIMKWIDILCDRGVLVTRNVLQNNKFLRMVRSGEADADHTEKKTAVLIPIIINLAGKKTDNNFFRIKSTLLNKITANLAYDYPQEENDFHNLYTEPYYFGPLTYCKNSLNDEVKIPIQQIGSISIYCSYDEPEKEYVSVSIQNELLSKEIKMLFSPQDSVPYAEIVSYIDFLKKISESNNTADSLNELAICRDQDVYYKHVHYDIISTLKNIALVMQSGTTIKKEKLARDASKIAKAGLRKLKYQPDRIYKQINDQFSANPLYIQALNRINDSLVPFSAEFIPVKNQLRIILHAELSLINLLLFESNYDKKYLKRFLTYYENLSKEDMIKAFSNASFYNDISKLAKAKTDTEYNELFEHHSGKLHSYKTVIYNEIRQLVISLPKPKTTEYVRINQKRRKNVAINKCENYIIQNRLQKSVLLFFDFSGFRNLDNTKSVNVVEQVKSIIPNLAINKDSLFVYGLDTTEPYGLIISKDIIMAKELAKGIKTALSIIDYNQIPCKFGSSIIEYSQIGLKEIIQEAWEEAKKCCKTSAESMDSHVFVISKKTYNLINSKEEYRVVADSSEKYYSNKELEDIHNKVITIKEDTDPTVKIGIITVLGEEFLAMRSMLSDPYTVIFPKVADGQVIGREFTIGNIRSLDNKSHKVVLTRTLGPGNTSAFSRASYLLKRFPNLEIILVVGIAGGIPNIDDITKHVRLGDIVISTEVVSYDFVSDKGSVIDLRGKSIAPSAKLAEAQNKLDQYLLSDEKPWERFIDSIPDSLKEVFARPSLAEDRLYDYDGMEVQHPLDKKRNGYPYVFKGKIASANRVLKDPQKRDILKDKYGVCAVEMEASGISDASWEYNVGYYIIRGISDYCDGKKNDTWHNYASLVAASYARALIEELPLL